MKVAGIAAGNKRPYLTYLFRMRKPDSPITSMTEKLSLVFGMAITAGGERQEGKPTEVHWKEAT